MITAQNDLRAKEFEADRLTLLANNAKNIDYMNARSTADIAEAVKLGKVQAIVIPYDFKGMLNVHVK